MWDAPEVWQRPRWIGYGCGSTPIASHFGVGEFTTHFRTNFSRIESDVRWKYGF